MSLVPRFIALVATKGSPVLFHREEPEAVLYPLSSLYPGAALYPSNGNRCPCRTDEGYRDPKWHLDNPNEPMCNEQGRLGPVVREFSLKGFIQPIQSTRATRLTTERAIELVGEIQADDHLAILPIEWEGNQVDLSDWDDSGEDYIGYAGQRFTVVNVNIIPDPSDGNPFHHIEAGLRMIGPRRANA